MPTPRLLFAALCLLFSLLSQSSYAQQVLFVTGDTRLSSADATVKRDLESAGMRVKVVDDAASSKSDAEGKDLVLISHSVFSARVGSKFSRVSVPVVAYEPFLYDDLGMSSSNRGSHGIAYNRRRNLLMQGTHPLTGGFSDLVQVSNRGAYLAWAVPGDDAIVAATLRANRKRATIFGYEAGATLANGQKAPARRVGLYPHIGSIDRRTSVGRDLFLNAVQWALSGSEDEPVVASQAVPEDVPEVEEPSEQPSIKPESDPVAANPDVPVEEPVNEEPVVSGPQLSEAPPVTALPNAAPEITDTSYQCDPVTEVVSYNRGDSDFFTLSVNDESTLTLKYSADSSNEAVAGVSVDNNGVFKVTALSRGESSLWLVAEDDNGLVDEYELSIVVE